MEHYVGIDVSLELSSVCVVDGRGKIVKEAKVASEPEALVCLFKELGVPGSVARPWPSCDSVAMTPGLWSAGLPLGMQFAARRCRWIPLPTRKRHKNWRAMLCGVALLRQVSTNPAPTGSLMTGNTIGTVRVVCSNGRTVEVPYARMTSGVSATNSAAC